MPAKLALAGAGSGHPGQPDITLLDSCYRIKFGTGFAGMTVRFAENFSTLQLFQTLYFEGLYNAAVDE
jgi:hypothetical protein